jgi:hypothetical protein
VPVNRTHQTTIEHQVFLGTSRRFGGGITLDELFERLDGTHEFVLFDSFFRLAVKPLRFLLFVVACGRDTDQEQCNDRRRDDAMRVSKLLSPR